VARALTQILERLTKEPGNRTLVGRYLALVADVDSEERKADHMLDLARTMAEAEPREAMRWAHLVYKADPKRLDAIQIVIDCLSALGRLGKAEVLRNEMERLRALQAVSVHPGDDREVFLPPVPGPLSKDQKRVALASLRDEPEQLSRIAEMVVLEDAPAEEAFLPEVELSMSEASPAEEAGETGEPSGQFAMASSEDQPEQARESFDSRESVASVASDRASSFRFEPSSPGQVSGEPAADPGFSPSPFTPRAADGSGLFEAAVAAQAKSENKIAFAKADGDEDLEIEPSKRDGDTGASKAAQQLFDHFWQQGFFAEAADVLQECDAGVRSEGWWSSRWSLVEKWRKTRGKKASPAHAQPPPSNSVRDHSQPIKKVEKKSGPRSSDSQSDANSASKSPHASSRPHGPDEHGSQQAHVHTSESFWTTMAAELARVARKEKARAPQGSVPAVSPPAELLSALRAASQKTPDLTWELVNSLWGQSPGRAAAAFLREAGLETSSPGYFGLWLDCLIATRDAHLVRAEAARVLREHPRLDWARVIWPRLEKAGELLGQRLDPWTEDDGVSALERQLSRQARQKFGSSWV
jgi:hypothetical protein